MAEPCQLLALALDCLDLATCWGWCVTGGSCLGDAVSGGKSVSARLFPIATPLRLGSEMKSSGREAMSVVLKRALEHLAPS